MTSKTRGYSYDVVKRIEAADKEMPSVQLGLECVRRNIPIADIAMQMEVSRQTVYAWFINKYKPRYPQLRKIEQLLAMYRTMPL